MSCSEILTESHPSHSNSHNHFEFVRPLHQFDGSAGRLQVLAARGRVRGRVRRPRRGARGRGAAGVGRVLGRRRGPEGERDGVGAEVGLDLGADVDVGRLARGVLDDEEELGDDLDDVAGLEDEVALPLDRLAREAAGDVGLTPHLARRARLENKKKAVLSFPVSENVWA